MKSLIKTIYNNSLILKLRNTLGVRKNSIYFGNIKKNYYISDNFLWRVDNNFITKFVFTDLLNIYYNQPNSYTVIKFYDKNSNFLKELRINPNKINEFIIDKEDSYFKNFTDYGYFQIFCKVDDFEIEENLSNRCYTGFSHNNNNFSYVHGNSYVEANSIKNNEEIKFTNLVKSSFIENQNYIIQNNFEDFDLVELFYVNPLNKKISIKINNEDKVEIGSHSIYKYVFNKKKIIKFTSDCCFLRPIVFCHNKGFLDVHHA